MASKFRPLFSFLTRVSCIDCQDDFSTVAKLNAHRKCGATHDLCPMVYQDQMQSIDEKLA